MVREQDAIAEDKLSCVPTLVMFLGGQSFWNLKLDKFDSICYYKTPNGFKGRTLFIKREPSCFSRSAKKKRKIERNYITKKKIVGQTLDNFISLPSCETPFLISHIADVIRRSVNSWKWSKSRTIITQQASATHRIKKFACRNRCQRTHDLLTIHIDHTEYPQWHLSSIVRAYDRVN